jgi:hypothetical protein
VRASSLLLALSLRPTPALSLLLLLSPLVAPLLPLEAVAASACSVLSLLLLLLLQCPSAAAVAATVAAAAAAVAAATAAAVGAVSVPADLCPLNDVIDKNAGTLFTYLPRYLGRFERFSSCFFFCRERDSRETSIYRCTEQSALAQASVATTSSCC